ncbi:putative transcription factor interactor and regulator Znf-B family [Helianthus annuus]|uniref:Putative B-box-type zinc finger n=1 Tax=Helianthus annuus TaxID=4232 RepID=A0A251RQX8_HELAN|nr:zinc finger protein CONSTANS-LIKE 2 [Helianthus annuus]KAF5755909.1 putative transcription factor interactor and regulator Znf-B family [Helianthus annuus]KAJ0429532.1 putative transcription factor interactor and regulator Znf-B family [Helianthus annuus]KAJ0434068.1 putative transcription factor interactor and regulator Znf-B family [Helianthus annuus]KAJ0447919.1 putative transcription factor interactor and regulator Znf-B family [Helianthus annuus]KAJ0632816.1 putative transcription fact
MKRCELCKSTARIYCESDRASLCWTCDSKVHSANFLVTRHSRSLLCRVCQSVTPWTASGEKLCRSTASVCGRCDVEDVSHGMVEGVGGNNGEIGIGNACGDEIDVKGSVDRVVARSSGPLPPAASSSSSDEGLVGYRGGLRKRKNVVDVTHEEDIDSSSVNINHHPQSSTMSSSVGTIGDEKKIRDRNIKSGEYVDAPILRRGKSRRMLEFDLNL